MYNAKDYGECRLIEVFLKFPKISEQTKWGKVSLDIKMQRSPRETHKELDCNANQVKGKLNYD